MKKFLLLLCVGCSSAPEPIGQTSQEWFNYCPVIQTTADTNICATYYLHQCKDGAEGYTSQIALGVHFIGTPCYQDALRGTFYYTCGVNDKQEAWVYCDYPGQ